MIGSALWRQYFSGFPPKPERFIHSSVNPTNYVAGDMEMNKTYFLPQRTPLVTDTYLYNFSII